MSVTFSKRAGISLCSILSVSASAAAYAQSQPQPSSAVSTTVYGSPSADAAAMTPGPEIQGIISARSGERMQVTATNGTSTTIALTEATQIKAGGLFGGGRNKPSAASLMNGLPVTVTTWQSGGGLVAREVKFKSGDLKTASMIHTGTTQRFEEQTAATQALRGRMGDIDQYNIKGTTNVHFDTGKSVLSEQAKADLCAAASAAQATDNALMLVVGYTDARGSDDYNQKLSEQRAGRVINYLQQTCGWKPYRMLTPTGMAKADPLADNSTPEGMAQNRRVAVNILVSKSVDGL